MIQEVEQLRPQVACEAMMFAGAQCASTSGQALLKEGSKHLGVDRAAGNEMIVGLTSQTPAVLSRALAVSSSSNMSPLRP